MNINIYIIGNLILEDNNIEDECLIQINLDEEHIPRFYIIGNNIKSCLRIFSNHYFSSNYFNSLNNKQLSQLQKWLLERNLENPLLNNWQMIANIWNTYHYNDICLKDNFSYISDVINYEQPDYRKIDSHLESESLYIGNIFINNIGDCKVYVYSDEITIPHFHITGINTNFNCCIETFDNCFFIHSIYKDTLNSNQCKQLHEWLLQKNKNANLSDYTNWEWISIVCSVTNYNFKCSKYYKNSTFNQPRYDLMVNFKSGI